MYLKHFFTIFLLVVILPFPSNGDTKQVETAPIIQSNNQTIVRRAKRYLDFIPLSRMFFRVNVKDNVQRSTQFWAQAYGYRANYPIENRRRMRRSEVYDTLTELINQHGYDGRACILKSFCEASTALTPDSGMIFKLFKMVFKNWSSGYGRFPEGDDQLYPYLKSNNCEELAKHCPLSFMNLSPYTDSA